MTKSRFLDYFYVGGQFLLFAAFLFPLELAWPVPKLALWPAQLAMILGLIILVWALLQLGSRISPFPRPKTDTVLITWGIFGLVRHPIYSGIFLFCAGLGLYTESLYRLSIAFVLLAWFYFKSRYEEKNMKAHFPEYPKYQKKTGRFFPKLPTAKPK